MFSVAVCFLNDISTLETEQLIIPEKLGSGENRGDFDYPAEKVRYTCGLLLRARITQVVGECIVEFTGVDVCHIEVAELYVEESIQ